MRLLLIHADNFSYGLTGKTPMAEKIDESVHESNTFDDPLVVFSTIESSDASKPDEIINLALIEIEKLFNELKPPTIIIYPYAHLSNDLGRPSDAIKILDGLKNKLQNALPYVQIERAPFGWYKSFSIACKGHPLSESSRHIISSSGNRIEAPDVNAANNKIAKSKNRDDIAKEVESEFFILNPDGSEIPIDINDKNILDSEILNKYPSLKKFIAFEEFKVKEGAEPPSVEAMRRLEIADHEDNSDSGHLRLYPKGTLLYKLISDWAEEIALVKLKCMEIETPLIYNWNKPDIKGQGESFHERHYTIMVPDEKIKDDSAAIVFDRTKEFVLRFAGDFGLFSMIKDAKISYKQLPLRFYEYSKSFRYERSGELSGLRRLRAFTMPDIHSFCSNIEEGFDEYQELYRQYSDLADAINIEYAVVFRIVKEYYDKYKDKLVSLLKYSKKPALIESLSKMKHYWALKHEFQGIDSVGGSCQLSTVQLDVIDAERYGINFVNEKGEKEGCTICHSSVGTIERWMYLLLEEALKKEIPVLPLWLSTTQVRIIPVSEKYMEYCMELMENISSYKIRTDIDDRDFSMGKKIMFAEEDWVPYILVVGEKEKTSNLLSVRNRYRDRKTENMTKDALVKEILDRTKDLPFRNLNVADMLSKRPIFVG
jgi:threonyl-tRNA synthetase